MAEEEEEEKEEEEEEDQQEKENEPKTKKNREPPMNLSDAGAVEVMRPHETGTSPQLESKRSARTEFSILFFLFFCGQGGGGLGGMLQRPPPDAVRCKNLRSDTVNRDAAQVVSGCRSPFTELYRVFFFTELVAHSLGWVPRYSLLGSPDLTW